MVLLILITFAFINQSVMELFKKSVILIVFSLLALLSSCRSKPEKHEQLSLPVNVRVHTVSETTLGSEREYVGVLEESNYESPLKSGNLKFQK